MEWGVANKDKILSLFATPHSIFPDFLFLGDVSKDEERDHGEQ